MLGFGGSLKEGKKGRITYRETNRGWNLQDMAGTWAQAEFGEGGAKSHGKWQQMQACGTGTEMGNGGLRVATTGEVRVNSASLQERRWGKGTAKRK